MIAAQLRSLFFSTFSEFVELEKKSILLGTSERSLCARLARILEDRTRQVGFEGYFADVEYNRKQDGKIKTVIDDGLKIIPITCDLILHSRGEDIKHDNLIALEMKRVRRPESDKQKDRDRLRALTKPRALVWSWSNITHPEHVCGYVLGFYVELDLDNRCFVLAEYRHGKYCYQRKLEI